MTQPKLKVKKGDTVIVISGKNRDQKGKVLAVYPRESRVVIEGVNMIKKHTKPSFQSPEGGIVEREAPLHVSNVALVDPKTGGPTRVGYKILEDGTKVRIAKKSGEVLD
ncbi:50S ribosomal protein L24 [Ferroacidibacillus organovorans]|uniref:Large ribosomal subunit protein uL24 n=1 Tax=Ferroacidibacillus organovorans TaxID=1765683 RepID=A0A1V4EPM3_9BACL|nr:50S ribosomal protein L24 [Ferroacidibacillus organovorans]OPG14876.1 50S ribosomal protein L24 [Ferroacidibacillus organovorans]